MLVVFGCLLVVCWLVVGWLVLVGGWFFGWFLDSWLVGCWLFLVSLLVGWLVGWVIEFWLIVWLGWRVIGWGVGYLVSRIGLECWICWKGERGLAVRSLARAWACFFFLAAGL